MRHRGYKLLSAICTEPARTTEHTFCVHYEARYRLAAPNGNELRLHDIKVIICAIAGGNILINSGVLRMEFRTVGGNNII